MDKARKLLFRVDFVVVCEMTLLLIFRLPTANISTAHKLLDNGKLAAKVPTIIQERLHGFEGISAMKSQHLFKLGAGLLFFRVLLNR